MADGSTRVVYVALAGNTLVAVTKFIAAVISGSSSMLTEAIHSTTDTANQLLLIVGDRRSRARADAGHDFGYGMEIYYWTFAVAIMILVAGGVLSLYTGWVRFHSPKPIARVPLSLIVLGLCAIFEGVSFMFAYREYRRVAGRHVIPGFPVGLGTFIRLSKDPNLFEPLLEDGAALVGLAIAAAGVIVTHLGIVWADGAASMAIGALLIVVAFAILIATKGLMGGEAVAPPLRSDIDRAIAACCVSIQVRGVKTLHLGPRTILIALSITAGNGLSSATVKSELHSLRVRLRRVDPRIRYVLADLE